MIKGIKPSGKTKSGIYKIKNLSKYAGDPSKAIYRSSYELAFCKELDNDKNVIKWEIEPEWMPITYIKPQNKVNGKTSRYYIDFLVEKRVKGKIQKFMVEVKPKKFVEAPKPPKESNNKAIQRKREARYNKARLRHAIIHEKRKAAKKVAAKQGMEYIFITDHYIFRKTKGRLK